MCNIEDPNDIISRSAIKKLLEDNSFSHYFEFGEYYGEDTVKKQIIFTDKALSLIDNVDPVIPKTDVFEWCHNCKEYDQEDHCCHRWSNKIREIIEEYKNLQLDEIRPHGHWIIKGTREGTNHCECSECNHEGDMWDKFCRNCGAKIDRNWIDLTDYCPTDCDGLSDYKPIWHWRCPVCDNNIFDEDTPPKECPECHTKLYL
jgi:hypothetical protein